jgi:hypothetical protein
VGLRKNYPHWVIFFGKKVIKKNQIKADRKEAGMKIQYHFSKQGHDSEIVFGQRRAFKWRTNCI